MAGQEYLGMIVDIDALTALVTQYVSNMETQVTTKWCKCQWMVHPDDVEIDPHNCAKCFHPKALHHELLIPGSDEKSTCTAFVQDDFLLEREECNCSGWQNPPKRRLRRGDQHPECPVHTKEGFLIEFFRWAKRHTDDQ